MKLGNMMKAPVQAGFTLIELMIVVGIVAVLAAVAIPLYSDHMVRAKVANIQTAADSMKTAVALCAQEAGGVLDDCDLGANGVPAALTPTKEVLSTAVTDGIIVLNLAKANLGQGVNGETVTYAPDIAPGATNLNWTVSTTVTHIAAKEALLKHNVEKTR